MINKRILIIFNYLILFYVIISHPTSQEMIGKYIPNFTSNDPSNCTILNLLMQGILLVSIYFGLKLFILSN